MLVAEIEAIISSKQWYRPNDIYLNTQDPVDEIPTWKNNQY